MNNEVFAMNLISLWIGFLRSRLLRPIEEREIHFISGADQLPPPLSRAEEAEAFAALSAGDPAAREKLIVHNLRLVVYIAKKFETPSVSLDDLISIGSIGLMKAVATFSPEKNIKLATYASRCIENEILMHLRKVAQYRAEISIDEPLNVDWDGNELLLSDILGSDGDEVGREIEQEDERFLVSTFVGKLPPREKQIMEMRFGMNGYQEYTQKQVADALGISQSYISRLEKRIIGKLKKQIEKAV